LYVLEEAGLEQRAGGIHQPAVIRFVPHVQRQGTKHAARRDPLQTVDTDIRDFESFSVCKCDIEQQRNRAEQARKIHQDLFQNTSTSSASAPG